MTNTWLNDAATKPLFQHKDLQLLMFHKRIKFNKRNYIQLFLLKFFAKADRYEGLGR
jgi:hypothetical protein